MAHSRAYSSPSMQLTRGYGENSPQAALAHITFRHHNIQAPTIVDLFRRRLRNEIRSSLRMIPITNAISLSDLFVSMQYQNPQATGTEKSNGHARSHKRHNTQIRYPQPLNTIDAKLRVHTRHVIIRSAHLHGPSSVQARCACCGEEVLRRALSVFLSLLA
jgi:hypothetical protein